MLKVRRAAERGRTLIDWLDSRHTFSFGEYHDARWRNLRALRVLNDDRVRAASGFEAHPHRDMEIVSLVLAGALEHKDSIGTGSVIRPGEVQRMSAGDGIVHSEWNPSTDREVHFLQMWFVPRQRGGAPGYEQAPLPATRNAFHLAAEGAATDPAPAPPGTARGAVRIASDADLWYARIDAGSSAVLRLSRAPSGGAAWVHVATGEAEIEGTPLGAGDGGSVTEAAEVRVTARAGGPGAEVLVFDLG
jgi:redox-sensitive bicupin YhaK (pirin superfamily)